LAAFLPRGQRAAVRRSGKRGRKDEKRPGHAERTILCPRDPAVAGGGAGAHRGGLAAAAAGHHLLVLIDKPLVLGADRFELGGVLVAERRAARKRLVRLAEVGLVLANLRFLCAMAVW